MCFTIGQDSHLEELPKAHESARTMEMLPGVGCESPISLGEWATFSWASTDSEGWFSPEILILSQRRLQLNSRPTSCSLAWPNCSAFYPSPFCWWPARIDHRSVSVFSSFTRNPPRIICPVIPLASVATVTTECGDPHALSCSSLQTKQLMFSQCPFMYWVALVRQCPATLTHDAHANPYLRVRTFSAKEQKSLKKCAWLRAPNSCDALATVTNSRRRKEKVKFCFACQ